MPAENIERSIERESFHGATPTGHCGGPKKRVIDGFFGGFYDGEE
jgi:hypothetical protein